jgi:putative tricarboxylic transport membrane protein
VRRISLVCGGSLAVLGIVALVEALRLRDGWTGARLMPAVVGVMLLLLGAAHARAPGLAGAWPDAAGRRRVVSLFVLLVLYVGLLPPLGFLLATGLFALPLVRTLGTTSWPRAALAAAGIAGASHVVFKHWLGMPLPAGLAGL